jgi:hypothetical protein
MGEMMEQLHVDPGLAAREHAFATACHRCLTCANSELCGHWLQQGSGNAAPFFCPNAPSFNHISERWRRTKR